MLREKIWGKHGYVTGTGPRAKRIRDAFIAGGTLALFITLPLWFFLLGF